MRKNDIRFVQVYRINGRIIVANSIEGAIATWREWSIPGNQDINNIERIGNDSYRYPETNDALMFSDISGDIYPQLTEELAEKSETIERLRYELEEQKVLIELGAMHGANGLVKQILHKESDHPNNPTHIPSSILTLGKWPSLTMTSVGISTATMSTALS